jgi:xylan 1,4-beta-xylosidase
MFTSHLESPKKRDMRSIWLFKKAILISVCMLFPILACNRPEPIVFEYQNPITSGIDENGLRDCMVIRDGDWWYMTGTAFPHWPRQENDTLLNPGVPLYKSKDLLNWEFVKYIVERPGTDKWYYRRFWAPEIQIIKGKYYALFNCSNPELGYDGQNTGYAVADHIEGPYRVVTEDEPLSRGNDLTFFEDDDGSVYAFWNRGREFGIGFAQIDLETASFLSEPQSAITPAPVDYAYDEDGVLLTEPNYLGRPIPKVAKYHDWDAIGIEGAYVIKKNDIYYLFYSSWTRGYEIGYATASSITGPWTKHPDNPFYGAQNEATCERNGFDWEGDPNSPFNSVGHNQIFTGPDGRLWLSCHGIAEEMNPFLVIDPIWFDDAGNIHSDGPTYTLQRIEY